MAGSTNSLSLSTILIVDDTPNNLQLLFQYLKNAGYKLLAAHSGKKAIETATTVRLDLILLDIMMSELDGFNTCRYLKSNPKTKDIPIIFMTALTETANKVKGFQLGAVDYITKPIEQEELLARIHTHLSLQKLNQRLAKDAARQKLLLEISDRIRQSLDLKLILQTAAQEVRLLLNCDLVWLASLENNAISLKAISHHKTLEPQVLDNIIQNCGNLSKLQHQSRMSKNAQIIVNNQDNTIFPELRDCNWQSRLMIPILINTTPSSDFIINKDILWGWLIADRCLSSASWDVEEIELLEKVTVQLAIAVKQGLLYQQISQLALLDGLTHIYNRRYFDRQLTLEWRRLQRLRAPLSLIMCDVDCFKIYNDTYGHQQGDRCLQQIAQAISSAIERPADIVARYGGEEFAIILPHTSQSGALKVAAKIRVAVKALEIPHSHSTVDSVVTLSIGIAATVPHETNSTSLLVKAADLALYKAKNLGRDCIAIYEHPISLVGS